MVNDNGTRYFYLINYGYCNDGSRKGLEKASKFMMPLLFVFLIVIVVKSLSLEGSLEGLKYILQPRLADISMEGVLFALGQSFFTLSLGTTGMITYASYASKEMTIKTSAVSIVGMNILVSILAGLAIFPAIAALDIVQLKDLGYYLKYYHKYLIKWLMDKVFILSFNSIFICCTDIIDFIT